MAIMCFGVGLSAAQGLHRGMLLIPMYLAFMIIAPPPGMERAHGGGPDQYLLPVVEHAVPGRRGALGGAGFPAVAAETASCRRARNHGPGDDTVIYTTTITVLCTASTLGR